MRVDDALPPVLPEAPRANAGIKSFSSSMENQMQVLEVELPVLAAAAVEAELEGNAHGRMRRTAKRDEDNGADRQKRDPENEEEKRSLGSLDDLATGNGETAVEEDESQRHELDVRL